MSSWCPYCRRAKALLTKGVAFTEVDIGLVRKPKAMIDVSGRSTVPQIFINGTHVGTLTNSMPSMPEAGSTSCSWTATSDVMEEKKFDTAFAKLPDGYSEGTYKARRFGVTVRRSKDGRRNSLLPELAGTDIVSFNLYRVSAGKASLKPCEMSAEKVVAFVLTFDRTHDLASPLNVVTVMGANLGPWARFWSPELSNYSLVIGLHPDVSHFRTLACEDRAGLLCKPSSRKSKR